MTKYEEVDGIIHSVIINENNVKAICSMIVDMIVFSPANYDFSNFQEEFYENVLEAMEEEGQTCLEYIDHDKSDDFRLFTLSVLINPQDSDENKKEFEIIANICYRSSFY